MADHYYSEQPHSEFITETWSYSLKGHPFTFTSGTGVFSKGKVDFGSALLVETFKEPDIEGDFLDLGCGYGPIGISLDYEYTNRHVVMVDVNERAVELTKMNANQNNVSNVTVIQRDGLSKLDQQATFAAIVMNPPIRIGKQKVYSFFEQCKSALAPSGELWIVIQDRKSTRLNSSHVAISYAVFCLKKKKVI